MNGCEEMYLMICFDIPGEVQCISIFESDNTQFCSAVLPTQKRLPS